MYNIVAIFGRSGSGKDTFLNSLFDCLKESDKKKYFHRIIRYTTRPMRDYEENGKPYYFISDKEMIEKILSGEIIEAGMFGDKGWVYGTGINSLIEDKINIGVFDIDAVQNLIDVEKEEDLNILPIFINAPVRICMSRSLLREENPDIDEIYRRYKSENERYFDQDYIKDIAWKTIDNTLDFSEDMKKVMSDILWSCDKRNEN